MEGDLEALRDEVAALRDEVARLRAELSGAATAAPPTATPGAARPSSATAAGEPAATPPPVTRRRVLAGLAGAAGVGAAGAVVAGAVAATPAAADPLTDGFQDLGEALVDWSSANPMATLQLRNKGGGTPLVVTGSSPTAPGTRIEQTDGGQAAVVVRQSSSDGTAPGIDVVAVNRGNALSAQGTVVGVFGVGSVYGVEGQSFAPGGVGIAAGGPKAALRLKAAGPAPVARDEEYYGGEVLLDEGGTLWCCVTPGRPGTWREVASAESVGVLHLLTPPVRVYDSRGGAGALADGVDRTVALGDVVPAWAQAVVLAVTSTGSTRAGSLTVFPAGTAWPQVTSLSFSGADVTGTVLTRLGTGSVAVRVLGDAVSTHVLLDLVGWFG